MRVFLKQIDIVGFKSFAEKTHIEFSSGITAVVGPNGSGKSNIADAIRWVLGEQSARNLRGSKMEDVIFAGSDSRRATNFCEVSLTLDNSDGYLPVSFSEVVITRRVYRSGESEYLLNKKSCRLKDIHELFMDSGMGRESYSIIGQGRIEEMLSTRPEDRRGPFEDAAGIVKYKFRRREAERKLEETAANIVRVDDILAELERQAGPLEQEAARAEQYRQFESELTNLDISLLIREIESLQQRWKDMANGVEQAVQQRQAAVENVTAADERLQVAKRAFDAKHEEADAVQRQLLQAVEQRQRAEGHLQLTMERARNAAQSAADRQQHLAETAQEIDQLTEQMRSVEARRSTVEATLAVKSGELEAAAHALNPEHKQRLEQDIANLNAELIEQHHLAATLRNELKMSEESMSNEDARRTRVAAEVERWTAEVERFAALRAQVDEEGQRTVAELQRMTGQLEQVAEQLRASAREEAALVSQINRASAQAASLQSKYDLLRELEEGYDGYALGVKTVLQQADKGRLTGVHGPLAALIQVDTSFELAVETALGGALQNIVVGTEADARAAIELLKQRQAGRATFMPLAVVRGRSLASGELEKVSGMAGYVGVASELVRCQDQYREVVRHLLGNVVVAKTLVDANQLARALGYRVRIVTLDGDVVSPGGVMSGGSHHRKGPGLLGRSRERSAAEKLLQQAQQQVMELERAQAELRRRMTALQNQQKDSLQASEDLKRTLQALQAQSREASANEQNARDRLQSAQWEYEQLSSGQQMWRERLESARDQLRAVEQKLRDLEQALADKRKALQDLEVQAARAQESMTELRVEVATLRQESDVLGAQLQDFRQRIRRLGERQSQLSSEAADFAAAEQTSRDEIARLERESMELENLVGELESRLSVVRQERQYAEAEAVAADKAYRAAQQAVTSADEQLHRAEVLAEKTDMELNHALRKLGERYHMTYEWAREHYEPAADVDAVRRQADALRRQMAALGDVQLSAIEEWKRLSERMTFLQRERADLDEARDKLEIVIAEIDEEMSRRFGEVFEQIRLEFQISFRQLFGGGRADLTLTNPEDLLTTGIDVIAQPPGKKLQNLNLLSGGERALTAMALLFAMLKVRPVPFCVLDEVEAALDEANVSRFAQQLRRFSADTQFIVITHRRGTMEEADALYGVTMQESGVSTLIGVRLADVDAEGEPA
nr:chromosome segregation protein SMC [Alicyclobacillus contaminans]